MEKCSIKKIISCKEFDNLFNSDDKDLVKLQELSDEALKLLQETDKMFESKDLSNKIPAYISDFDKEHIHIKYPSYKIDIYPTKEQLGESGIESVIKNIEQLYDIRDISGVTVEGYHNLDGKYNQKLVIYCTALDIVTNKKNAEKVKELIIEKGYLAYVLPNYIFKNASIEWDDTGEYFRVTSKNVR